MRAKGFKFVRFATFLIFVSPIFASGAIASKKGQELVIQSATGCNPYLIEQSIPEERVIDVSASYVPHKNALDADSQVVGVEAQKLNYANSPVTVSELDILDVKTGKILVEQKDLLAAANKLIFEIGRSEVTQLDLSYAVLSRFTPHVAFSVSTRWQDNYVMLYNYETHEIKLVVWDKSLSPARHRWLHIEHDRFLVSSYESHDFDVSYHSFYDLQNDINFNVVAPAYSVVRISSNGKKVLMSTETNDKRNRVYKNRLVKVPKNASAAALDLTKGALGPIFEGHVIASSADLNQIVIDRNNDQSRDSISQNMTPWVAPDLALVRVKDAEVTVKGLSGWKPILDKIYEAAAQGLIINTISGVKGEMSADGSQFSLNLKFESNTPSTKGWSAPRIFNQDWIGLWDLPRSKAPTIVTSQLLDSLGDSEPNPANFSENQSALWKRKFASRMMPDGLFVIARATVEDLEYPNGDVHLKVFAFRAGVLPSLVLKYHTGPIDLDPLRQREFRGVTDLQIGASGRTIMFNIKNVGAKIVDLNLPEKPMLTYEKTQDQ